MRRYIALILIFVLLFVMTACQSSDGKDTLRICIDITNYSGDISNINREKQANIDDFLFSLKESGGLDNIEVEIIPDSGPERDTAISRIRTEMMSGKGPDVFIVDCTFNLDHQKALFPFPEKVMEAGLFLPLDEYMENNTEFTKWDQQQQTVLAAGRNEEGQQMIPLSYTFPVQTSSRQDCDIVLPDVPVSWQDTLTDPTLFSAYAEFNDCSDVVYLSDENGTTDLHRFTEHYFEHILGKLVDFKYEKLLFSEDELLQRINEIIALIENNNYEDTSVFSNQFMGSKVVNNSTTILPMFSDDGGICVSIRNFAAINRNTQHPDEAYRVIDILLREHTQLTKPIFRQGLCSYDASIPLYDETFHKDAQFNQHYFADESYEMYTQVKEQIASANYRSSLSYDLTMLLMKCTNAGGDREIIENLVHTTYEQMQRKVRE